MEGKTPMSCGDEIKTLLSRYVDGELSPEERARADEHVAACVPCRDLLQLFQKNESLLSNALSTESFGNSVIEAVISEIKRDGVPAEAKPVEEGPTEWFRSRPIIPLAAAALFVASVIAILNASHSRDLDSLTGQIRQLSEKVQTQTDLASRTATEYERTIVNLRAQEAIQAAPKGMVVAIFAPQHLVVRASFDPKLFGTFAVYRRGEGESSDRYVKVSGDRRLDSPEYIDTSVKTGQAYVYKFRAYRSTNDDDFVESAPITMRMPKTQELAPEWSIRVQCVDVGVSFKVAKFLLHRIINGRTVTEEFVVKPGERLGEVRDVPGFGKVDFRTTLTLDRLAEGTQTLSVFYTKSLLDQNGKEIMERINKDGTIEVKTEQQEGVLSIRPNLRAFFRTSGASAADVELWKGSWLQVRAQD